MIDLRSDTVTQPTEAMREAMRSALVGDDVYGEDPTVNELQERCASLTGMEAGLFVSSGTMGNIASLLAHCQRGDEIIVGSESHIFRWEQGSAAGLGGIHTATVRNSPNGTLDLSEVRALVRPDDVHCPCTKLICIENTLAGRVISPQYMADLAALAKSLGLLVHLDGARIFNAAIALNLPVSEFCKHVDSVQFCFSKGLAAPVGSMICGTKSFIAQAKRARKMLGGGMRQAGVLAAACDVSLHTMIERLAEDHENAAHLAQELKKIPGLKIDLANVQTNMVFVEVLAGQSAAQGLKDRLTKKCVSVGFDRPGILRLVTHYGIGRADIDRVAEIMSDACAIEFTKV